VNAQDLLPGDQFVEMTDAEWQSLAAGDRKRARRITLDRVIGRCGKPDRLHLKTSAGDWCIPLEAPVILLEQKRSAGKVA